jgi:glycosyltransferase involved in cell wall biosynthesis
MPVRILFVIDGIEFGGGERVFAQIINGLPQDRFKSFLATASNKAFTKTITIQDLTTFPMDFSNRYNVAIVLRLMRIIKEEQIDIVHGQGARAEFYARLAAGFSGRKTYVSTVAVPVESYDVGTLKKLLYMAFDRFSEGYVNRFVVVSDSLVKAMVHGHGLAREKVIKIYNGIETDIYQPADQSANRHRIREEFRIADKEMLIGAIGRLAWPKGFEFFIQAIPDIIQALPNGRFLLVGDGALRRDLETLARSLNLQNHLLFAGQRTDIRDILAAMDIVVVPSIQEGFPVLTLEAMAMEKPIVATAIDGITEQITNAKEGLLVPTKSPADLTKAIVTIASNPIMADTLGKAARRRVTTEFSVQQMIKATIHVYDDLL